jgi:hypothetical protein
MVTPELRIRIWIRILIHICPHVIHRLNTDPHSKRGPGSRRSKKIIKNNVTISVYIYIVCDLF